MYQFFRGYFHQCYRYPAASLLSVPFLSRCMVSIYQYISNPLISHTVNYYGIEKNSDYVHQTRCPAICCICDSVISHADHASENYHVLTCNKWVHGTHDVRAFPVCHSLCLVRHLDAHFDYYPVPCPENEKHALKFKCHGFHVTNLVKLMRCYFVYSNNTEAKKWIDDMCAELFFKKVHPMISTFREDLETVERMNHLAQINYRQIPPEGFDRNERERLDNRRVVWVGDFRRYMTYGLIPLNQDFGDFPFDLPKCQYCGGYIAPWWNDKSSCLRCKHTTLRNGKRVPKQ